MNPNARYSMRETADINPILNALREASEPLNIDQIADRCGLTRKVAWTAIFEHNRLKRSPTIHLTAQNGTYSFSLAGAKDAESVTHSP